MTRYLIRRLGQSLLMVFGVLVLVFGMLRATGDPTNLFVPRDATAAQRDAAREAFGFDRPLIVQFFDFLGDAVRLDFGDSSRYQVSVVEVIADRAPASAELAVAALLIAIVVGIPLGVLAGLRPGTIWDSAARGVALAGQTVPSFWLALLFIVIFGVELGWFPSFGRNTVDLGPFSVPDRSIVMPAVVLATFPLARILRFCRSSVLEIANEDYVTVARAKGLSRWRVSVAYVLRNSLVPLISVISLQMGALIGGSLYVEAVFAWPGVGGLMAEAVGNRDFQLVQGLAFFGALLVIFFALLADVLYTVADPRIRLDRQRGER